MDMRLIKKALDYGYTVTFKNGSVTLLWNGEIFHHESNFDQLEDLIFKLNLYLEHIFEEK